MPKKPTITVGGKTYIDQGKEVPVLEQGPTKGEQLAREQDEKERQRAEWLFNNQHLYNFGTPYLSPEEAAFKFDRNRDLVATTAKAGPLFGGMVGAPVATTVSLIGGKTGELAVDKGMKLATGKSWAENMSDWTGMDEGVAGWTNPGIWIGGAAAPYKARVAAYNNKTPYGYGNSRFSRSVRKEITDGIVDFINPLKWKPEEIPRWKRWVHYSPAAGRINADGENTLGALFEFRDMMYRHALRLPQSKNGTVFVKNADGTLGLDMDKVNQIRQAWGGTPYDNRIVQLSKVKHVTPSQDKFVGMDNIVSVGGRTNVKIHNAPDGKKQAVMTDDWDIQPFKEVS